LFGDLLERKPDSQDDDDKNVDPKPAPSERAKIEERLGFHLKEETLAQLKAMPVDRSWWSELICRKTGMSKDEFVKWRKEHKERHKAWPSLSDLAAKREIKVDELVKVLFGDLLEQEGAGLPDYSEIISDSDPDINLGSDPDINVDSDPDINLGGGD